MLHKKKNCNKNNDLFINMILFVCLMSNKAVKGDFDLKKLFKTFAEFYMIYAIKNFSIFYA